MFDVQIMTVADVKRWLRQGKAIAGERRRLLDEKYVALEIRGVTTVTRQVERRIARGSVSHGDTALISYCDFTKDLDKSIAECDKHLAAIHKQIKQVSGYVHRIILIKHYTENKLLKDIAFDVGLSPKEISKIHVNALEQLKEILTQL